MSFSGALAIETLSKFRLPICDGARAVAWTQATTVSGRILTRSHSAQLPTFWPRPPNHAPGARGAARLAASPFEGPTICSVLMQSAGLVNDPPPPPAAAYGAPVAAAAALTPSLFTIRGEVAGTPPVNNARKDRFTKSGAPRMWGT